MANLQASDVCLGWSGEVEGDPDVGGWGKRLPSELFFESEREDGGAVGGRSLCISKSQLIFPVREQ